MKIAFDFHGVLEKYPEQFKLILQALSKEHHIIILSGPPYKQIVKELQDAGYAMYSHYMDIISVVDWIKDQNVEMKLNELCSK